MRALLLVGMLCGAGMAEAEGPWQSQVPGLTIVALQHLPPAPQSTGERDFCRHLLVEDPATAAGREAAAKGWSVTAEAALGPYSAVSFVGDFAAATSGTCDLLAGNVGLFRADQLVALVYAPDPAAELVGLLRPLGDGGLRLFTGDLIPTPVADLRLIGEEGVAVLQPAGADPVCGGVAEVPYLYGLPIDEARKALASAGWHPVPGDPGARSPGLADDLVAAGISEVEDCSGTGFAFCAFGYAGPAGRLGVTTAGEVAQDGRLPAVTAYGVDCGVAAP